MYELLSLSSGHEKLQHLCNGSKCYARCVILSTFITPSPDNTCLPCWSHNKPPSSTLQVLCSVPCDLLPPSCPQSGPYHTSSSNQPLKSWVVSHSVDSSTNASKETTIGYDTLSILAKTWDNSGGSKEIYLQYLLPAKGKSHPAPCFCLRVMFSWSKQPTCTYTSKGRPSQIWASGCNAPPSTWA